MRMRPEHALRPCAMLLAALLIAAGCSKPAPPPKHRSIYASAEEVEENFRDQPFVLGTDNTVAEVQPTWWDKDKWLKLPFWFGVNILVPGVKQPKEGDYYVISEAQLGKPLEAPGEWMIEAGSTLVKQQTVLQTTRVKFFGKGKLLPMIVQYMGLRSFTTPERKVVEIPVVREVSLPMKWTLGGRIPESYARFHIE
jgi:hypothetical protein